MFNRLLTLLIAVAVQSGTIPPTQTEGAADPKVKYILPEGFHGWACVDYGVKDAAPLKRDAKGVYLIEPVAGGIVATSSFPHLIHQPFASEVMQTEKGQLRPVEIHSIANRGEYATDNPVSRYCLFFGSNEEAALAPRPPTLRESELGTTPVLQRVEFSEGALCDFRDVSQVCLEASDVSNSRIARTIAATVPQISMKPAGNCDAFDGIVVRYHAEWSMESGRSVPPHRNAIAQLQRHRTGKGTIAMATWVDVEGGGAEDVATRFGRDLADFFRQAATVSCPK
jgi:hypothetical protein